ncbi:MAG: PfkB family carbohydrate kinase [Thermonemataceae bacterium]
MKVVTLGEVMMRLAPPNLEKIVQTKQLEIHFGGSEANIAVALAQWGLHATHVTSFPDQALGYAAKQHLQKYGVDTQSIVFNKGRLGLYFLEQGAALRGSQIIYDRYGAAFAESSPTHFDWEVILEGADWLHWSGITPALSANCTQICLQAVQKAVEKGLTVSGDIYFRSGLWQFDQTPEEVLPDLVANSHLVLADVPAMTKYLGIEIPETDTPFQKGAEALMKKYPRIQKVVDTERISHSANHNTIHAQLWNGEQLFQSPILHINPIVDRIGAGDAFFAGLIYGWQAYQQDQKALDFGICSSALKHTFKGDVQLADVAAIESLMKGNTSGVIKR